MNRYICQKCKTVSVFHRRDESFDAYCTECSPESPDARWVKTLISAPMTTAMVRDIVPSLQPQIFGKMPEAPKPSIEMKPSTGSLIIPAKK